MVVFVCTESKNDKAMTTEELFNKILPPHPGGLEGAFQSILEHLEETHDEWIEECEKRDLIRTISEN